MSNVTKRGAVKPTLNITPLIDVVFLLIVFFLLVNNIVTDEVPELKLPELEKPETRQNADENRIIINIIPEDAWEGDPGPGSETGAVLARRGTAKHIRVTGVGFDVQDPDSLMAFRDHMVKVIGIRRGAGNLKFLLRVDATIYYSQVLPVMELLQAAMIDAELDPTKGETMIDIVAYMPQ